MAYKLDKDLINAEKEVIKWKKEIDFFWLMDDWYLKNKRVRMNTED